MNEFLPRQISPGTVSNLEENTIGAIWQICFVANNFVFPINAFFDKNYGLSRMEFVVLYVLSHRDNLMAWEICRMTGLPKNNISRGIKKLEQKKLIARSSDPQDARRFLLKFTPQGRQLFDELIVFYSERATEILTLLDEKDQADLSRITIKLSNALFSHKEFSEFPVR